MAADVLRARRFPEDALDYYGYAMARGGHVSELLNRMGVVRLELRQTDAGQRDCSSALCARRRTTRRPGTTWASPNTSTQQLRAAIADYQRAVQARQAARQSTTPTWAWPTSREATWRARARSSTLRHQARPRASFSAAMAAARPRMCSARQNYAQLCFEMAQLYARDHDDECHAALAREGDGGRLRHAARSMHADRGAAAVHEGPSALLLMLKNAPQMRMHAGRPVELRRAWGRAPECTERAARRDTRRAAHLDTGSGGSPSCSSSRAAGGTPR